MFVFRKKLASQGITWEQLVFQFLVVLVGVYLAISFERWADDHSRQGEANAMLGRIVEELRLDEEDLNLVIAEATVGSPAADSLLILLEDVSSNNGVEVESLIGGPLFLARTVFPRGAAYTALVSGGYLTSIADQELALRLANLYEHTYDRLGVNTESSDQVAHDIYIVFHEYWDRGHRRFITPGINENIRARNAWLFFKENYFDWYVGDLVPLTLEEVTDLRQELEAYLAK